MAQNGRVHHGWSQPRKSVSSKSPSGCTLYTLSTASLNELDIVNLLSGCNKPKVKKDPWTLHHSSSRKNPRSYQESKSCCLKDGRIQCSCLSKYEYSSNDKSNFKRNFRNSGYHTEPRLAHEKVSNWSKHNTAPKLFGNSIAEEYVLDDNELDLNFYDMPFDLPKQNQTKNVGKVKTVSIIDTLSELASGATDHEDECGFSSGVSKSATLCHDPCKSCNIHRMSNKRNSSGFKYDCLASPLVKSKCSSSALHKNLLNDSLEACHKSVCESQLRSVHSDDDNFTCNSLKQTLKYLRKAVSTNVVEEEPKCRRHTHRNDEKDAFRQCFSDSEVREIPKPWSLSHFDKTKLSSRTKSRSLLTVTTHPRHTVIKNCEKKVSMHSRTKIDAPEWIKNVFVAAKLGEVQKLKAGLKDIDVALVRNLSDDHGNNLWHICAAYNHIQCLEWLCFYNHQQAEALKDENKHGFNPVSLAVKHGSLLAVQWLILNTSSKTEVFSVGNNQSLLHIAAKYGQEATVQWLLGYMASQKIDLNIVDSEGNTALHLASKHGHISCVKVLVLHCGNLKARNDRGLKPLNLAFKYSQTECVDYLVALESCYNLASNNLKQQSEILQLQKENSEIKNCFKELLSFTRRLQQKQKELVQTFARPEYQGNFDAEISERNAGRRTYVDEYLLATVLGDDEHRLLVMEDAWKKSQKLPRYINSKKNPIDVVRSQFTNIVNKVSDQSSEVLSTPETSDESVQSEDDNSHLSSFLSASVLATPDVIHELPSSHVPFKSSTNKQVPNKSHDFSMLTTQTLKKKHVENVGLFPISTSKIPPDIRMSTAKTASSVARDVNLQVFFKRNPNLRQSSETCSVLEVLEPSSSDSDEGANKRHKLKSNEDETLQSSSSSAAETLIPSSGPSYSEFAKCSIRRSSSGSCQKSTNERSVSNHQNLGNAANAAEENLENNGHVSNINLDTKKKEMGHVASVDSTCSAEPDLIKGAQKRKRLLAVQLEKEVHHSTKEHPKDAVDSPSISTEDSESLDADHSFYSAIDVPYSNQAPPEQYLSGSGAKKKSFLFKFALKSRWPSKQRPHPSKNEISAEEFRETYSRSSENPQPPSQCSTTMKKPSSVPSKSPIKLQDALMIEPSKSLDGNNPYFPNSYNDYALSNPQQAALGFLPPRREPPPVPPRPSSNVDSSQMCTGEDLHVNTISSASSFITNCMTESSVSLHHPYVSSRSSNVWQSPDTKMFRPSSSASHVELSSRVDENFSLNKSSSASTEMLSALDFSNAGHQSPAPSEVSKTESALSPPSDVSKTESARYLSQLGKIEESTLAVMKLSNVQKPVTEEDKLETSPIIVDTSENKGRKKSGATKRNNPDKPWYEFSDEEDSFTPQMYEAMSGRMCNSSEDEEAIMS